MAMRMSMRSFGRNNLILAALLCATAGCSFAQTPAEEDPSSSTAAAALSDGGDAKVDLDDIFGPLDEQEPTVAAESGAMQTGEEASTAADSSATGPELGAAAHNGAANDHVDFNTVKVHQLTERVAALETEVDSLLATIRSLNGLISDMQDPEEISRQTLGAMVQDPDIRTGLGEMLQGKVRLINETGESRTLYVNGTPWTVVTGESFVYSPVGMVSFLTSGDDEPTFKGIQEWVENETTGQFEVTYQLGSSGPTETSVMKPLPKR